MPKLCDHSAFHPFRGQTFLNTGRAPRQAAARRSPRPDLAKRGKPMKLYSYFRSSAAFRVRIALNLKGLAYEQAFIHLRKNDQRSAAYLAVNPQGLVPSLID